MGYHVCEKSQRDTDYHLNRNATSLLIRNISALAFGGSSRGPARPSRGRVAWSPGRRLLSEPLDGRPVGPGQLGLGPTCESRLWGCGARPRLPGPGRPGGQGQSLLSMALAGVSGTTCVPAEASGTRLDQGGGPAAFQSASTFRTGRLSP